MTSDLENCFVFGTKAETLECLKPLLSQFKILDHFHFSINDWKQKQNHILEQIIHLFPESKLAIRSSTLSEDTSESSMAGAFLSLLNIETNHRGQLKEAIEDVIDSFPGNPRDQVLIQPMAQDIAVSGVITTYNPDDGAPYYVLNYDDQSGKTDTVTGGIGVHKAVLIHRETEPKQILSSRVRSWIDAVKELEQVCGPQPLDVEFCQTKQGTLYLFQVRPMAVSKNWDTNITKRTQEFQQYIKQFVSDRMSPKLGVLGQRTILGGMPDWNPAEIIGTHPRPLASSLYQYLITDKIWRIAREKMGYRKVRNQTLMTMVGGKPFIDVRNSFNSFLPATLDETIGEKLINAWLDQLDKNPGLHDKVEFEVAFTIFDFSFDSTFDQRYPGLLTSSEKHQFSQSLCDLTQKALSPGKQNTLTIALKDIDHLIQLQKTPHPHTFHSATALVSYIKRKLYECKVWGTLPFSIIARHAFIAETLLRSAATQDILTEERLATFRGSLHTITHQLSRDFIRVEEGSLSKKAFLEVYGHLRPGTYDLMSLRYDQRKDLFDHQAPKTTDRTQVLPFVLTEQETEKLETLLKASQLNVVDAKAFITYCAQAISNREYAKFIFTKSLSDTLELLVQWGNYLNLSRDDVSYLSIEEILQTLEKPLLAEPSLHFKSRVAEGRQYMAQTRLIHLTYLIRGSHDLNVAPLHRAAPNFVTHKQIECQVVEIHNQMTSYPDISNKIVCIENADPGFDWIFTRGIAGLVTKFGGSNSHMAIRCAEFGLPAAIGCGEDTFNRLVKAGNIALNCANKTVKPTYGE